MDGREKEMEMRKETERKDGKESEKEQKERRK